MSLEGAQIKGGLNCTEAVFSNPDGVALNADGLAVDADLFLHQAQCTGEVRLVGAHIGGQLDCTEASFSNPDGDGAERRPADRRRRHVSAQGAVHR